MQAPPRVQLLFWALLGCASVILTEVVTFSFPFPFVTVWGLLVICPLYTLHVLVLAWLIFRRGAVSLYTLFLAGALLGMYEAYVTKVLWNPTWGDATVTFGGVYVVQTAILVLFYHPLMAFVLPLLVCESLFTTSRELLRSLHARSQRWISSRPVLTSAVLGIYGGAFHAVAASSVRNSLTSVLLSAFVWGVVVLAWKRWGGKWTLRDLLPSDRQATGLIGLLLIGYLWQGVLLRPEALPRTLLPHLTVWAMYLLFGGLLWLHLRHSAPLAAPEPARRCQPERLSIAYFLAFASTSVLGSAMKTAAGAMVLVSFLLGIGTGLWLVLRAAVALRQLTVQARPTSGSYPD